MKCIVLCDSLYGNTKRIAHAIANILSSSEKVEVIDTSKIKICDIDNTMLLIVGSPTHGGCPKPSIQAFLESLPAERVKGIKFAVFDTRFLEKDLCFALRILVKVIGYAAPKMGRLLIGKGGRQILPPEGFFVKGKTGPLAQGELERATNWAKQILKMK